MKHLSHRLCQLAVLLEMLKHLSHRLCQLAVLLEILKHLSHRLCQLAVLLEMLRRRGELSGMCAIRGKDRILTAYLKKRDYLRTVASPG